MRKGLAALCCAACMACSGFPALAAPAVMWEDDSGEKMQDLLKEDTAVWVPAGAVPTEKAALEVGGKSALLLEASSGKVLFEKNPHEKLPIASVTKVMTLLLVMEAVECRQIAMEDSVTCSSTAASMGGSQIWLEVGEIMTVHELVKAAAVVSANDACAMLAEYISGSIEGFVARMNERAEELGMADTHFLDCSGLSDEAYSSAYDVALMSRELLKHEKITAYTTIWMDTLREEKSQLVNTNKLIRHYTGAIGLKTGTTQKAGHCLSGAAQRDGMKLVGVILGCTTTEERFGGVRKMLDFGFANYGIYTPQVDESQLVPMPVLRGVATQIETVADAPQPVLVKRGQEKSIAGAVVLVENVEAPVLKGQVVGEFVLTLDGNVLASYPIRAAASVERMRFHIALYQLLCALCA